MPMKLVMQALLLGGALLLAHEGQAQTQPPAPDPAQAQPATRPVPGARRVLAPRRAVAPRRAAAAPVRAKTSGVMEKDGLTLKEGRVMFTELGLSGPLEQDKRLPNGTTVTPKGQVTSASGAQSQLSEGDYVSLTGRLTTKREMVEADSVRKLVAYDLKHPGKRKEMEKAREKTEKAREKAEKELAKAKAKAGR